MATRKLSPPKHSEMEMTLKVRLSYSHLRICPLMVCPLAAEHVMMSGKNIHPERIPLFPPIHTSSQINKAKEVNRVTCFNRKLTYLSTQPNLLRLIEKSYQKPSRAALLTHIYTDYPQAIEISDLYSTLFSFIGQHPVNHGPLVALPRKVDLFLPNRGPCWS